MDTLERLIISVDGVVQGVGFRPFVYREAAALGLRGRVRNDGAGVRIDIEGAPAAARALVETLHASHPRLARITRIGVTRAEPVGHDRLVVDPSGAGEATAGTATGGVVVADLATCDDCLRELFDPADRRHRYPFLSCTQCGPRVTVVDALPYDRERTTMAAFPMCAACRAEYEDPADRRFHAQTTACPACGPQVALTGPDGALLAAAPGDALRQAASLLLEGRIVAIKGIGGFHLACDATNDAAVRRLRARKHREAKPFAIMIADLDAVARCCELDVLAAQLLAGVEAPIVLLPRIVPASNGDALAGSSRATVSGQVAPGRPDLGVMLPYTPLHHLLCRDAGRPLVMTSGNRSDEPMAVTDDDALERLDGIADAFLLHDRRIALRCDDSVVRVIAGAPSFLRRSRGWVPQSVRWPGHAAEPVLATGGHLKNTFCIVSGDRAFLSPHSGDLENAEAYLSLRNAIGQLTRLLSVTPAVIAHDLHPGYASTRLAHDLPASHRVAVQHHHAHVVSCMAEHGIHEPVLGVAFDGTGLGDDGAVWGGEFLIADARGYERVAHLAYVPLPGGEAAIRHPMRMAFTHLYATFGQAIESLDIPFAERFAADELRLLRSMMDHRVLAPPTSSMGRLFDAVAALIGVQTEARYEGQPAMALEAAADPACRRAYEFDLRSRADGWVAEPAGVVRAIARDMAAGRPATDIAAAFHNGVRNLIVQVAERVRARAGIRRVALSGGVFQNRRLTGSAAVALARHGFDVLLHRHVPCNDGGLAFGQAVVAASVVEDSTVRVRDAAHGRPHLDQPDTGSSGAIEPVISSRA